jgi:ATP-dependent RNA circularization protein (DNA/RNA ligase family)
MDNKIKYIKKTSISKGINQFSNNKLTIEMDNLSNRDVKYIYVALQKWYSDFYNAEIKYEEIGQASLIPIVESVRQLKDSLKEELIEKLIWNSYDESQEKKHESKI